MMVCAGETQDMRGKGVEREKERERDKGMKKRVKLSNFNHVSLFCKIISSLVLDLHTQHIDMMSKNIQRLLEVAPVY